MRRWFLVFVMLLLAACGNSGQTSGTDGAAPTQAAADSSGDAAATQPAADSSGDTATTGAFEVDPSKLSDELYFYNWSDYVDPAILEDFEAEYGVRVIVDTYDANEDMIAKVRAGGAGYDIAVPSDYAVGILAEEDLLTQLDQTLLPNLVHVDNGLRDLYFDKGNAYSVPYFYGITGIAYNKQEFPDGIDSWAALFDVAQLERYKGRFSMLDDERETPGAALKYLGKSLNETDPTTLAEVRELLQAQKPFLAAYNSSDTNRKMASGEYVLAHSWSGAALQARNGLGDEFSGNPDIEFVIPKEGGMIWMDNMVILKDSPNAYTAHVFINFMLRPEIAVRNSEYVGYLTPNKDAVPLLSPEVKALYDAGFAPNEEIYKRLEWAKRDASSTAFTDLWTEVKGE